MAGDAGPTLLQEMLELRRAEGPIVPEPHPSTRRGQVLELVRKRGEEGATDEEIRDALLLTPGQQRPPRIELAYQGLVRDSGRTRLTRRHRAATVWVAT